MIYFNENREPENGIKADPKMVYIRNKTIRTSYVIHLRFHLLETCFLREYPDDL
ncbi:hypothetical protein BH18THE2_BH18THE2_34280 [soil metagenome]